MKMNCIMLMPNSNKEDINFKQIFSIDSKYVGQACEMSRVFQDAVVSTKIEGKDCLKFDFDKALQLVKSHKEMALVGIINQTISQSSSQASVMVNKVMELMKSVLSVTLTASQKKSYEECIEQAFSNLAVQEDSAFIFWQRTEAHKTTYQYNILFAIQNEETGGVILALPIALTITVEVDKEHVLGITIKDKENYSVNIQAIQVVEPLQA